MGELADIKLFLEEATTTLVVSTWDTIRKVSGVTTAKKALIEPGEILSSNGVRIKKKFKIRLSVATEAIMTSIINEIIEGCIAFNRRAAGFTYPATMNNIEFIRTNKSYIGDSKRWLNDIFLDIKWVTT